MWIRDLDLVNFRNLIDTTVTFQPGTNWLVGGNGMGKTNCLEACYFSLTGKSFRTPRLADLSGTQNKEYLVAADLVREERGTRYAVQVTDGGTKRFIGQKAAKPMDMFRTSAIMAFTSRSKSLVEGSPDDRRRFLDRMISTLDPDHMLLLARYRKAREQLKPILLKSRDLRLYRGFKGAAVGPARQIVSARLHFIEEILDLATEIYGEIFSGSEQLALTYRIRNCRSLEGYEQRMLDVSAQELLHGKAAVGPQLDDLDIQLAEKGAKKTASSGQIRSIVLSIKLAVRETYKNRRGFYPILLLDDIDAELDPARLDRLIKFLEGKGQALISTSKYGMIRDSGRNSVYKVDAGRIEPPRNDE